MTHHNGWVSFRVVVAVVVVAVVVVAVVVETGIFR